jgi:hypothetical protein
MKIITREKKEGFKAKR